jgi:predicted anti-sigma-YlaC factor YlaD
MSQAKVDRYKEEKRNRQKIMKREKREWAATKAGLSLIGLVLVAWVGFSVYSGVTSSDTTESEKPTYTINTSAVDDFLSGITEE